MPWTFPFPIHVGCRPGAQLSTLQSFHSAQRTERSALADMVTNAVAARGRGMKPFIDPTVEGLSADTNVGVKSNTTANGAKLPGKYKKPISKG